MERCPVCEHAYADDKVEVEKDVHVCQECLDDLGAEQCMDVLNHLWAEEHAADMKLQESREG